MLGTMIPLLKDGRKSKQDSNNYRAITLGSIISKLYDIVIMNEQSHIFDTSHLQFGFKQDSSTTQCTFVVKETISYYIENDSSVYTLMLDASKAFDRVNYTHLFRKRLERKMSPIFLRYLLFMYTSQKNNRLNGTISCHQCLKLACNGVRQGAVLSPLLFGIYIDGLLVKLRDLGIGCCIGQSFVGAVGYADDLTLLCPTFSGLKNMIRVCENYAAEHNIIFNGKKSKLLIFNKKKDLHSNIKVCDEIVPVCTETMYLGHKLNTKDFHSLIKEEIKHFNVKTNYFLGTFSKYNCPLKNKLFTQYCCTMYGSPLWSLEHKSMKDMAIAWRKAERRIWRLPYNTHCDIVSLVANEIPMEYSLSVRFIRYMKTVLSSKNQVVHEVANNSLNVLNSTFAKNIRHVTSCLFTNLEYLRYCPESMIKNLYIENWFANMNPEYITSSDVILDVIDMRDSDTLNILTNYECQIMLEFLCTNS